MISPLPFRVVPCTEWGAAQPKGAISRAGKPVRTIFHHTAGHVPNLSAGETYEEARAYARAIQRSHFRNGWLDSGHNFLITRGGYILEGRHRSLAEIRAGKMVASAHCPGQNDQPGIEHEQVDPQALTPIQREASIWLHAWILARRTPPEAQGAWPASNELRLEVVRQRLWHMSQAGSATATVALDRALARERAVEASSKAESQVSDSDPFAEVDALAARRSRGRGR